MAYRRQGEGGVSPGTCIYQNSAKNSNKLGISYGKYQPTAGLNFVVCTCAFSFSTVLLHVFLLNNTKTSTYHGLHTHACVCIHLNWQLQVENEHYSYYFLTTFIEFTL